MTKKRMDPILFSREHRTMLRDAELTKEQMGGCILALMSYQYEGKLPEDIDPVSLVMWRLLRADMKRHFGEGIR